MASQASDECEKELAEPHNRGTSGQTESAPRGTNTVPGSASMNPEKLDSPSSSLLRER